MKILTFSKMVVVMGCLSLGLASPAMAETVMEQSQSASTEVKVECNGTCKSSASSNTFQHQFMSTSLSRDWDTHHRNHDWSESNRDGEVSLTWTQRGGTCHVRYSEATSRTFRYTTSAVCDEGTLTIGGLVPGRAYRFQVKKDNEAWSTAKRLIAS